eukprot:TRINITY_DN16091_c1_g1_i1.p1 TRINITY_DN16091_c1_g1~~TRINITY_DN16091_c1_g1_i1.p1  ORF type:complete len:335 (-),score=101.08 TRINITY_DN16091_c1_g1_i1:24-1028(-)
MPRSFLTLLFLLFVALVAAQTTVDVDTTTAVIPPDTDTTTAVIPPDTDTDGTTTIAGPVTTTVDSATTTATATTTRASTTTIAATTTAGRSTTTTGTGSTNTTTGTGSTNTTTAASSLTSTSSTSGSTTTSSSNTPPDPYVSGRACASSYDPYSFVIQTTTTAVPTRQGIVNIPIVAANQATGVQLTIGTMRVDSNNLLDPLDISIVNVGRTAVPSDLDDITGYDDTALLHKFSVSASVDFSFSVLLCADPDADDDVVAFTISNSAQPTKANVIQADFVDSTSVNNQVTVLINSANNRNVFVVRKGETTTPSHASSVTYCTLLVALLALVASLM